MNQTEFLKGKVALVTGAARGQGRAHALALARAGADVALLDICRDLPYPRYPMATREELSETAEAVRKLERRALELVCDVRQAAEVEAAVARTVEELGRIDILVCNAGVAGLGASWEISEEAFDIMLDVNLKGSWLPAKYVAPHMIAQRSGRIIFISSTAGLRPLSWMAHYNAAKMGVVALMKTMAIELGQYNVTVNSLHPTGVNTEIITGEAAEAGISREALAAQIGRDHVLPVELLEPQDMAEVMLFLTSDAARYITGQTLAVDAGYTLH
jgi:SDR family mycofactocin-dependent oxidoreductase